MAPAENLDPVIAYAERDPKSIGHEETFAEDLVEMVEIRRELLALAVKVGRRLRQHDMEARTVAVKVRYHDFTHVTRSITLSTASADGEVLYQVGCTLLAETMAGRKPMRLLGITGSNLLPAGQARPVSLFAQEDGREEKRRRINQAVDRINETFGNGLILPATLVKE